MLVSQRKMFKLPKCGTTLRCTSTTCVTFFISFIVSYFHAVMNTVDATKYELFPH